MAHDHDVTLGRYALLVSPLCLGAMTFGVGLVIHNGGTTMNGVGAPLSPFVIQEGDKPY